MVKFSPSILTADFVHLGEAITELDAAKTDMLHLDVMDGIFVPNISIGIPVVASIRKATETVLDVHLMIDRPHRYIEQFAKAGADIIGFHTEAGSDIESTLKLIKSYGKKTCLTIKPATPAQEVFPYLELCDMVLVMSVEPGFGGQKFIEGALPKIAAIREEINKRGLDIDIEVDGGVNMETAPLCVKAGANVLVTGNVLFSADDMTKRLSELREITNI
ncbi:MAG: ribulose-phosphate 3-epimerase [Acutalibacteraceae bacterium]|nr:ribulose-phosphate 3-epimerase [Acutalibacteraceae bacterium]